MNTSKDRAKQLLRKYLSMADKGCLHCYDHDDELSEIVDEIVRAAVEEIKQEFETLKFRATGGVG